MFSEIVTSARHMTGAIRVLFPQSPPRLPISRLALLLVAVLVGSAILVTPQSFAAASDITFEFDLQPLFTSASQWVANLAPVYSIPIGITIAVALLTGVGALIAAAFKFVKGRV